MKAQVTRTGWIRVLAAVALATPAALALTAGSGNAALQHDGGELTRFEIDGDAVPGVSSNGSPANGFVEGDWGLVDADYGYGPQSIGSSAADPPPAGIGSTGTLPLAFDQSRGEDHPLVDPAPNPQFPTIAGATEFCPTGVDDGWGPGAKLGDLIDIDDPLFGPDGEPQLVCHEVHDKSDIFRAFAAYEVAAVPTVYGDPVSPTQNHTVLYGAWERQEQPGELHFYIPVIDSIPGNSSGDRLIVFDYNSSTTHPDSYAIKQWDGNHWVDIRTGLAGENTEVFQTAVGYVDGRAFPDNGQPSFGEFSLDLTATGVLPTHSEGECLDLTTAGYMFTATGNSESAAMKDYVRAPRLPLGNCGDFEVDKAGPDVTGVEFRYRAEQEDQAPIFPIVTTPPGQNPSQINDFLAIGGTDLWTDVFAQPDYVVFEPQPLVTDPAAPGWEQVRVDCTYVDAYTTGYPIVTEALYLGADRVVGEYLQVHSDAVLELTGHAGFVPSCTITNDIAGIIIEKAGAGDPAQVFTFDANGEMADLVIGDSAFLPFEEGTQVAITEMPLVGADPMWDLTSIDCYHAGAIEPFLTITDGNTATIEAQPSMFVNRCVFTNVQRGSITIEKTAVPDIGQSFDFETLNLPGFALADGEVVTFEQLAPGAYAVREIEEWGWELTDLTCTSGLGTSAIAVDGAEGVAEMLLAAGDAVTCAYVNEVIAGELTIEKVITGPIADDLTWSFGFELADGDGVIGADTITGMGIVPDGTLTFTDLVPGTTYTVGEWELPPGWTLNGTSCLVTSPNPAVEPVLTTDGTFTVSPGSTVLCTFDNSPGPGELTIEKVITGPIADDLTWSFGFELADGDGVIGADTITGVGIVSGGPLIFTDLVPGTTYTVTETAAAGWTENSMSCTVVPAVPEGLPVTTADGSFTVLPGSRVFCTFDNTPDPGTLTLAKVTEGGDGDFTFALAAGEGPPMEIVVTTTGGTGSELVTGLVPGTTYTVIELDPGEQWIAGELLCTVVHADGTEDLYEAPGFTVVPGDSISCGITNVEQGLIIVDKVTDPADDTTSFDFVLAGDLDDAFTVTGPGEPHMTGLIPPGTYTVTEAAEAGWEFQGVVCDSDGASVAAATATIELAPGEVVTCTFTNARRGPLTITKTVTAGPVEVGVDIYELTYRVAVTSQSYVAETYDLTDVVLFGDGVTLLEATATGPASVALLPGWNGLTSTLLVDDATIDPLATHVFTIEATGQVDLTSTEASRDCVLGSDEDGTGLLNEATVTWSDGTASDDDCRPTPEPDQADMAIVKTASVSTTGPNGGFAWILDVTNNGPAEAVNVVVGDLVPTQLVVTGVSSDEFTCGHVGNAVSCSKASMEVGETGQVTIAVVVPAAAVSGSVTNVGTVESETPDTDLTNNSDDAIVDIVVQIAPTTTAAAVEALPETGSDAAGPLWLAMLLVLTGAAVLIVSRRRRVTI